MYVPKHVYFTSLLLHLEKSQSPANNVLPAWFQICYVAIIKYKHKESSLDAKPLNEESIFFIL